MAKLLKLFPSIRSFSNVKQFGAVKQKSSHCQAFFEVFPLSALPPAFNTFFPGPRKSNQRICRLTKANLGDGAMPDQPNPPMPAELPAHHNLEAVAGGRENASLFGGVHWAVANHKLSVGSKLIRESTGGLRFILFSVEWSPSFHNLSCRIPNGIGIHAQGKLTMSDGSYEGEYGLSGAQSWWTGSASRIFANRNTAELGLGISGTGLPTKLSNYQSVFLKGGVNYKTDITLDPNSEPYKMPFSIRSKIPLWQKGQLPYVYKEIPVYKELHQVIKTAIREELGPGLEQCNQQQGSNLTLALSEQQQMQVQDRALVSKQIALLGTNSLIKLNAIEKTQNDNGLTIQNKFSELKAIQETQGTQANECCETQIENLKDISNNVGELSNKVNEITPELQASLGNGLLNGITGLVTLAFGNLTLVRITTFIQTNLPFWFYAYITGAFLGVFYYKILMWSGDSQIKKNPWLNCVFIVLRITCAGLSIYTFGLISVNIIYNLLAGFPIFNKFTFLKNGMFIKKCSSFISDSSLAQKFIGKINLIGGSFCVVNFTLQLGFFPNQAAAITFSSAAFAVWRYRHVANPSQFFIECVAYTIFAAKYNMIFRYMSSPDTLIGDYTLKQQLNFIVTKFIFPLPDFLPRVPIPLNTKKNGFKIFLISGWDFIFNRNMAIRRAFILDRKKANNEK